MIHHSFVVADEATPLPSDLFPLVFVNSHPLFLYRAGQIPDFPGARMPLGSNASFNFSLNFLRALSFQP
jgi:hypothetical protein